MKKLLSIFLSFSLIFSLVMMKESLSENQVVYAASENQFEEEGAKVAYEFWPLLKALVEKTLSYGWSKVCVLCNLGSHIMSHTFSVLIDLFTGYKDRKIRELEEEKKRLKSRFSAKLGEHDQNFLKFLQILKDNENNKNYFNELLNGFMEAANKMEYLMGI